MILNDQDLLKLSGGTVSASYINAIARGVTIILEIGRAIGSSIRRGFSKNYC